MLSKRSNIFCKSPIHIQFTLVIIDYLHCHQSQMDLSEIVCPEYKLIFYMHGQSPLFPQDNILLRNLNIHHSRTKVVDYLVTTLASSMLLRCFFLFALFLPYLTNSKILAVVIAVWKGWNILIELLHANICGTKKGENPRHIYLDNSWQIILVLPEYHIVCGQLGTIHNNTLIFLDDHLVVNTGWLPE